MENLVWILGQKGVYIRNPVALPHWKQVGGGEIGLAKKEKERSQRKSYQKGDTSLSQSCEIGKRVVTVFNIEKVPCGFHSVIAVLIHGRPLFENWMQQKIVSSKLLVLFSVTNRNVFWFWFWLHQGCASNLWGGAFILFFVPTAGVILGQGLIGRGACSSK